VTDEVSPKTVLGGGKLKERGERKGRFMVRMKAMLGRAGDRGAPRL